MSVSTSRTSDHAQVVVDHHRCTLCKRCLSVCSGSPLFLDNERIGVDHQRLFGCIGCGHCVAICPFGAIQVEGRTLSMNDFQTLPAPEQRASYPQLYALMQARRSIRKFSSQEVEPQVVDKILQAAANAPMGIPPSDVQVVVLQGKEKVSAFSRDFCDFLYRSRFLFSTPLRPLWWLMMSKNDYRMMKEFVFPVIRFLVDKNKMGEDWVQYNAPLATGFFGGPASDPADADIAATYATLAADALGLGHCFIGTIPPFIKTGAKKLRQKYSIPDFKYGIWFIAGYPAVTYQQAIQRSFASVKIVS